jgi:hypothetical protein
MSQAWQSMAVIQHFGEEARGFWVKGKLGLHSETLPQTFSIKKIKKILKERWNKEEKWMSMDLKSLKLSCELLKGKSNWVLLKLLYLPHNMYLAPPSLSWTGWESDSSSPSPSGVVLGDRDLKDSYPHTYTKSWGGCKASWECSWVMVGVIDVEGSLTMWLFN